MAQFFGHEHNDIFRATRDNGPFFVSPSLRPNCGDGPRNPAIGRRYHYDKKTLTLLSYE